MSKTNESETVTGNLKELGLPTMRRTFAAAAVAARANEQTFEQYLLGLSDAELSHRRENRIGRLLRASKLPLEKSWAALDTKRLPAKVVHQAKALLDGGFVDRRENVLEHSIGKKSPKETVLTRSEFCSRLTRLRDRLKK